MGVTSHKVNVQCVDGVATIVRTLCLIGPISACAALTYSSVSVIGVLGIDQGLSHARHLISTSEQAPFLRKKRGTL